MSPKQTAGDEPNEERRPGRPRAPVWTGERAEPGASYVTALRRWPETAGLSNAELADKLGLRQSTISGLLQNSRSWRATSALLRHARTIILACGGTRADVDRWTAYHHQVVTYELRDEQLPLPTPPAWPQPPTSARQQRNARYRHLKSRPMSADPSVTPYAVVRRSARGVRKDYRLEPRRLGAGGQAEVFPGKHKATGTTIAYKRLTTSSRAAIKRMEREIEAARRFGDHPNVMPVLDADPGHTWFVMPLAEATASEPPVDLTDSGALRDLVTAVCAALAEPHRVGWVHRDLKPDNLLLLNGVWKVADWGLGRRPRGQTNGERLTAVGRLFGTEGFAAPEQYDDAHEAGPQADVYSIGQIIGWALTGQLPRPNLPLLPATEPWRAIVRTATALEPRHRPADANDLLSHITTTLAVSTREPLVGRTTPSRGRRAPSALSDSVIREVYRQADELDWTSLPPSQKSGAYTNWVEDPAIGGVLNAFQRPEAIRVWLKDTVMREYPRAKYGCGPYARLTMTRYQSPDEIVHAVCGNEWTVQPDSFGDKPYHCLASNDTVTRYICWGTVTDLRNLIWANLNTRDQASPVPLIVIHDDEHQITGATRQKCLEQAHAASTDLVFLIRRLVPNEGFGGNLPSPSVPGDR